MLLLVVVWLIQVGLGAQLTNLAGVDNVTGHVVTHIGFCTRACPLKFEFIQAQCLAPKLTWLSFHCFLCQQLVVPAPLHIDAEVRCLVQEAEALKGPEKSKVPVCMQSLVSSCLLH